MYYIWWIDRKTFNLKFETIASRNEGNKDSTQIAYIVGSPSARQRYAISMAYLWGQLLCAIWIGIHCREQNRVYITEKIKLA